MAQRATVHYNYLNQLCINGVPQTHTRRGVVLPIFRIAGGSPEGEGEGTGEGGSGEGGSSGSSGSEGQQGSSSSTGSGEGEKTGEGTETVTKADLDAITERMKAADRRATAAEQKVKEYEDKDKGDLQKATERVTELEGVVTQKDETIRTLVIRNAFLAENSYTWHDPEDAFGFVRAELKDAEVDEDGKLKGVNMKNVVKSLADRKKYLVKTETATESSGTSTGSSRRKGEEEGTPDKAKLKVKFPALQRR